MPYCVVLRFGYSEFLHLYLGVPHRHVDLPHAAAVAHPEYVANPQVDVVDPPERCGAVRHLGSAVFGDGPLIQILS